MAWYPERLVIHDSIEAEAIEQYHIVHDTKQGVITEVRHSCVAICYAQGNAVHFKGENNIRMDFVHECHVKL